MLIIFGTQKLILCLKDADKCVHIEDSGSDGSDDGYFKTKRSKTIKHEGAKISIKLAGSV